MFDDDSSWSKEKNTIRPLKNNKRFSPIKASSNPIKKKKIIVATNNDSPDIVIDLHENTLNESFILVSQTIKYCYLNGLKSILFITGKGDPEKAQTIQQELPRWLDLTDLSQYVVRHNFASEKNGGRGARILTLKRRNTI